MEVVAISGAHPTLPVAHQPYSNDSSRLACQIILAWLTRCTRQVLQRSDPRFMHNGRFVQSTNIKKICCDSFLHDVVCMRWYSSNVGIDYDLRCILSISPMFSSHLLRQSWLYIASFTDWNDVELSDFWYSALQSKGACVVFPPPLALQRSARSALLCPVLPSNLEKKTYVRILHVRSNLARSIRNIESPIGYKRPKRKARIQLVAFLC